MREDARVVFQGEIFRVYQWPQEMYDGTSKIFERAWRTPSVGVIPITPEGKLLLSYQYQPHRPEGFISLFGGMVDPDESPLLAAQRELQEESGYTSSDWQHLFGRTQSGKIDYRCDFFLARRAKCTDMPSLDAGEKIEVMELDFDGFIRHILDPKCRDEFLRLWLLERHYKDK